MYLTMYPPLTPSLKIILSSLLLLSISITGVTALAPISYCKSDPAQNINFCVAVATWFNSTSHAQDLYVTITTKYPASLPRGWQGVGIGPSMRGAMMFIVFGDPTAPDKSATAIVRTAVGHRHPEPLSVMSPEHMIPDVQVRSAKFVTANPNSGENWNGDDDSSGAEEGVPTLTANFVCYNCTSWQPGTVNTTHPTLPWLWAANPSQDFSADYSANARLNMHNARRHLGTGMFWADMPRSFMGETSWDPPAWPTVAGDYSEPVGATDDLEDARKKLKAGGSAKGSGSGWVRGALWHLHGVLLASSFLLLYPLGAYFVRAAGKGVMYHGVMQGCASFLVLVGVTVGFVMSGRVGFWHQYIGLAIAGTVIAQAVFGWRAHVGFLKSGEKQWVGNLHRWVGVGIVGSGACNVVLGLRWRGYSIFVLLAVIIVMAVEVAGVGYVWWRVRSSGGDGGRPRLGDESSLEEYAMLDQEEDFDEDAEELGGRDGMSK
jgi:hypothetical protein